MLLKRTFQYGLVHFFVDAGVDLCFVVEDAGLCCLFNYVVRGG